MSEVNEEKTSGDFREMGLRLAQEVISFVKKKMDKASRYGNLQDIKISFVGHSIGNVIIRTALSGRWSHSLFMIQVYTVCRCMYCTRYILLVGYDESSKGCQPSQDVECTC